jgi:cytochrome c556
MDRSWTYRVVILLAVTSLLAQPHVAAAQTEQTKRVMRQKLAESQQLLGALVTRTGGRSPAIARRSDADDAARMGRAAAARFHNYTTGFQKAVQALADAAGRRDQRTALSAYNALVSSCVECHLYVAGAHRERQ